MTMDDERVISTILKTGTYPGDPLVARVYQIKLLLLYGHGPIKPRNQIICGQCGHRWDYSDGPVCPRCLNK